MKKLLEKLGEFSTIAIIGLALIGATGTAALLQSYGTVDGSADVDQAVTLDTTSNTVNNVKFDFDGSQTAGETVIETHTMYNNADVDASVGVETTCSNSTESDVTNSGTSVDWSSGGCTGIDTDYVEYFDSAGHDFTQYSAPNSPDKTVGSGGSYDSVGAAIADASTGETILVESGSYESFDVNKSSLTVVAANAPNSSSAATVDGDNTNGNTARGTAIDVTADDTTVKGFEVKADVGDATGNGRGIDVKATNVVVDSNYIHNVRTADRPIGIHLWANDDGAKDIDVSNAEIVNNHIETIKATDLTGKNKPESKAKGIALDGQDHTNAASNVNISYNTVEDVGDDTNAAMATGINIYGGTPVDFTVKYNKVTNIDHNEDTTQFSGTYRHPYAQGLYLSGIDQNSNPEKEISHNNFLLSNTDATVDAQFADYDPGESLTVSADDNYWGLNGKEVIDESSDISDQFSWKEKSDLTIEAGSSDKFGIVNEFKINLMPDSYSLETSINPS